jgi:acetyl-CoA synthetase
MRLADSPLAWFEGYAGDLEKSWEKFSRDGKYYLTGDIARMDADGHIHFCLATMI